ncbi:MAG: hypothetical protein LRY73_20435 [Bacillus sp. (in: Bacteria)]|nr:hypothetical protein [Bacillus sp. (in: firmicutes)]
MGLIESILGNPFLLFIIIAALLSFFRGANQQQEQKGSGKPAKGNQTGDQGEIDWREIFRQEQAPVDSEEHRRTNDPYSTARSQEAKAAREPVEERYSAPAPTEKEMNRGNKELYEKYEEAKRRKAKAFENAEKYDDSPIFTQDLTRTSMKLNFNNISKEEAVKGIVWSEILGKPKARRTR